MTTAVCLFVCIVTSTDRAQSNQEAETVARSVRRLLVDGRFSEAETEARRLFPAIDRGRIDDSAAVSAGDLLVEALVRNGRGADARTREIAQQIIRAKIAAVGSAHASLASSLRNLGDVLLDAGEYPLAVARFREALALREQATPAKHSDIADDLAHLGRALTETGQYDEALSITDRALMLKKEAGEGPDPLALASTLRIRGVLHRRKGLYKEARSDFERSLTLLEAFSLAHPDTAVTLTLLGEQLSLGGDLLRARETLTRAVSVAGAALRPDHPDMALSLGTLAANLQELGSLAESRALRERAVEIAEKAFGSDHPMLAIRINDLANTCSLQGEYARARQLYERARDIYRRRLGADHLGVTTASYNLALLHSRLGDFLEARRQLEAVLADWERIAGRDHPDVARPLSALANLLADMGLDREAQPYFDRALRIRERVLGPNHPHIVWILGQRAESLARLGQHARALDLAARGVNICETSGAQHCLVTALNITARLLRTSGNHAQAAAAYQRALEIGQEVLGSPHPIVAGIEIGLAESRAHLRDRERALAGAFRGDAINRNHSRLTLAYLSERQALDYAADHRKGLDLALSLISGNREAADVLDAVVQGRSLVLDELGARERMRVLQKGELAALWTELASARQRLANLVVRGPDDQRPGQYAILVDDARRAKEGAERKLAEQSAAFRSELKRTDVDLAQVRAALPPDGGLVSFVRFNRTIFHETSSAGVASPASRPIPSYVAFVLPAGTDDPTVVPLGRADTLESLITEWRRALLAGIVTAAGATGSEGQRSFRARGIDIRRRLWDPIAAHLNGVNRIYIVPDGAINLVPLVALPAATGRFLLEDGPVIHYLSAERDLVAPEQPLGNSRRSLLAVGGPEFADRSVFAATAGMSGRPTTDNQPVNAKAAAAGLPAPTGTSAPFRSAGAKCRSFQSMQFEPLPGSRQEVQEVEALWQRFNDADEGRRRSHVLIGRNASESAIKQVAPGNRILHLATHGFFLGDRCASALDNTRAVGGLVGSTKRKPAAPHAARMAELPENPLLLSGLAMAGANRRAVAGPDEDDGILTAEEVASLDLQGTEWAVLSACSTGVGQIKAGEGVFGLRRAFQIAGARTVIMSLWSVDDQATRTWMRALYDGRLNRRLNTADAVRNASLAVLRERRARGQSTHPFYWAAFVAAGDWH